MHTYDKYAAGQDKTGVMAMGALLADMNHDIRTSMNGVRGMLDLLLDTGLTPSQQEYARTAQHSVDNLLESLERIVDMSLIESNSFRFNQAPFDLLQEVRAALAAKPAGAHSKGIALSVVYPPSVRLLGDAARLREVFSALADVALQYASGETMSLAVNAIRLPGEMCRVVLEANVPQSSEDSGSLASMLGGGNTGNEVHSRDMLGMAVCTQLVHRMKGSIEIDRSRPPATLVRVTVDLPLAMHDASGPRAAVDSAAPRDAHGAAHLPAPADCTVLVADDNPVNQQVAARMLEKLGYKAEVASDGMQAVEMHNWKRFDLILMDCEMPVLDGLEATQRIRAAEGSSRRTPIVALTASTGQGEQERCLAAGMDDFLAKPIRPQLLGDLLARWLQRPAAQEDPACTDELEKVKDMFGADFAELAALYQQDGAPRLAAMREAAAAGDRTRLAKVSHALGGSCASIGATGLSALCKALELSVKAGSVADVDAKMDAIEAEYRRVCGKLQSLLEP
ncbi:hybrid sensor histidine kinase/response regulator [Noviherbaspirillum denitrificans]|uniref:histidine kinase n=1 Tax=Noviherbaspirillum denitrificans TaxID=1968433 RepID=A0A254THK7_9BURK|nr:hybrid sensor histidine kinase/response regulator [Noviherbaspirillum denitrificans]OWW22126.1 hypothetical protein AYR66_24150 [Noviherbaspirillum denitrificans]